MSYTRSCKTCGAIIGFTARVLYDQCQKCRPRAHPTTNYKCKHCKQEFVTYKNALRHLRTKHGPISNAYIGTDNLASRDVKGQFYIKGVLLE
jgi:hypothetical protein